MCLSNEERRIGYHSDGYHYAIYIRGTGSYIPSHHFRGSFKCTLSLKWSLILDAMDKPPVFTYLVRATSPPQTHSLPLSLSPFLCTDPCEHFVSNCTEWKDVAHLSTDKVSYEGAQSTIIASFDGNDTNVHYMLCYHYFIKEPLPRLIDSLTGNTSVSVNFSWPRSGIADLLVRIHNSSNYTEESYLGCATTSLSVAREL